MTTLLAAERHRVRWVGTAPGGPLPIPADADPNGGQSNGGRRHVVNLSHGVDRETPVANFEAFVRAARGE
jgi:hypothetical protein